MRCLLYCLFDGRMHPMPDPPAGVGGHPVSVVVSSGLGAAISRISESDPALERSHLLAYEGVIELFHRDRTVIPMRYGCVFEEDAQVAKLLEQRCAEYAALLGELDGWVEMGIRVLMEDVDCEAPAAISPASHHVSSAGARASGAAHLARLRDHYTAKDRMSAQCDTVLHDIYGVLSGLFGDTRKESCSLSGRRLLSIYFLVPRAAVGPFREAFHRIRLNETAKVLLSGPWPPYNFVYPESPGIAAGAAEKGAVALAGSGGAQAAFFAPKLQVT